jgi:hypothetical protein
MRERHNDDVDAAVAELLATNPPAAPLQLDVPVEMLHPIVYLEALTALDDASDIRPAQVLAMLSHRNGWAVKYDETRGVWARHLRDDVEAIAPDVLVYVLRGLLRRRAKEGGMSRISLREAGELAARAEELAHRVPSMLLSSETAKAEKRANDRRTQELIDAGVIRPPRRRTASRRTARP